VKFVPAGTDGVLFSVWDVRVKDYRAFVEETGGHWHYNSDDSPTDNDPAVAVSWDDAHSFCDWLTKKEQAEGKLGPNQSYRLPTDAEWSKAVGLGDEGTGTPEDKNGKISGVYPWGTQWPPPSGAGNYDGEDFAPGIGIKGYRDGYENTSPVGSFNANKYGLYDMGGNVLQWCEDKYNNESDLRVLRGSSFISFVPDSLLSSFRDALRPTVQASAYGFRVVVVVSP
jgi:formylglycine-generating enzyme required for sulfatase activity